MKIEKRIHGRVLGGVHYAVYALILSFDISFVSCDASRALRLYLN